MSTPHPHAESMLLWAEDHATIPPAHEWEYCVSDDNWHPVGVSAPGWTASSTYRRVAKAAPNYRLLSATEICDMICDWNGSIPNELAKEAGVRLLILLEDSKELFDRVKKMEGVHEEVRRWVQDAPDLEGI